MALDLETINDNYFSGAANATPQGVVGDQISGYHIPFEQWPEEVKKGYRYDPEGAKRILEEAGYPNGFKTILYSWAGSPDSVHDYIALADEYWKAIGVDVEITRNDRPTMMNHVTERTWEGLQATVGGWNRMLTGQYAGAVTRPQCGTSPGSRPPSWTHSLKRAEAAATIEEQMRHARQADMVLIEQQGYVWGPHAAKFNVAQPWIKGYNGEVQLGSMDRLVIFSRLWIDQALKQEMGN